MDVYSVYTANSAKILGKDDVACVKGQDDKVLLGKGAQASFEKAVDIGAARNGVSLQRGVGELSKDPWQGQYRLCPARPYMPDLKQGSPVHGEKLVYVVVPFDLPGGFASDDRCQVVYAGSWFHL